MSEVQQNERKLTALNEVKLRLTADPQPGSRRRPWLGVSLFRNQPRLEVQTNVEGDKRSGFINANMDSPTFFALLSALNLAIQSEGAVQYRIKNMTHVRQGDERSQEMTLMSTTYVGKDDEGCVFLSVVDADKDRPRVKFVFGPTDYHVYSDGSGEVLNKAQVSVMYAEGWCTLMRNLIPHLLVTEFVPYEPKQEGGENRQWNNNNGGGGQRQWNNGGQKKQWNNGGGGQRQWNNGGQKKQWNNNGQGGQKKQWNNNNGGGGQRQWNNNNNNNNGNSDAGGGAPNTDQQWSDNDFPM